MWPAIISAVLPVLLAFIMGLCEKYSQHALEDAPGDQAKADDLNAKLAAWKAANGAP